MNDILEHEESNAPMDRHGLPDLEAYLRMLTDEQVHAWMSEYGEPSREWILGTRELERRNGRPYGWTVVIATGAALLACALFVVLWT